VLQLGIITISVVGVGAERPPNYY